MLLEMGNFGQYLANILDAFRWQDIIDIALVAMIIYKVCALTSGTRAVRLIIGLSMLIGLSLAAYILNLESLLWILEQCFSSMLIIMAIIFQPEIRKILEEMGRGKMFHRNTNAKRAETLSDEVCRALVYCANHNIGAILVLERETGLKDFCESSISLNADITYELIISIFWVNNPLHDGAVIINQEKILSGACYLPLTDETNLSRWLGTRHRAGIGITEVSDAVSLIVSEERGEISLASNGRLSRNLKEPQLRNFLKLYFSGDNPEEQTFREAVLNRLRNFKSRDESFGDFCTEMSLKLLGWVTSRMRILAISLLLTIALWGFHAGNRNEEIAKTFEVRLELRNPPAELSAFASASRVSVTLSGERRAVNSVEDLTAAVDLKGLEAGLHSVPVIFRAPARMTAQVNPKDIEVRLVRMIDKDLPVRVTPPADMPEGYVLENASAEPDIVTAHGREDQLASLDEITVTPSLADLQGGAPWRLPLRSPDDMSISFSPADVMVDGRYARRETNKITVEVVSHDSVATSADRKTGTPVPPLIVSSGIDTATVSPHARITSAVPILPVTSAADAIPAEITEPQAPAIEVAPQAVQEIEVREKPVTAILEFIPVAVRGAADGTVWTVEPSVVTVIAEGTAEAVKDLTVAALELSVYVDVSNIVADSIPLPLRIQYNTQIPGIESVKADLATVKVTREHNN